MLNDSPVLKEIIARSESSNTVIQGQIKRIRFPLLKYRILRVHLSLE